MCVYFKSWNNGNSVAYEESYGVDARKIKVQAIKGARVYYFKVNEENDTTCYVKQAQRNQAHFEVFYSASSPNSVINSIATSNVALDFANAQHLLLPQEEISRLPSSELRMEYPEDARDPNTEELFCEQFNGENRIKAGQCLKFVKDGKFQYRWEDGTITVTTGGNTLTLDGAEAGLVMLPNDRICRRNRQTGITFCTRDNPISYTSSQSSPTFASTPKSFSGGCRQGMRWSSQIYDEDPKIIRVGLYYCVYLDEHEGQPAPLEFSCSPGDEKYFVRSAIAMPHTEKSQQVYFQIDRLGLLLTGHGEHNEMTGENDLEFEILPHHELIDSLAAGTSGSIRAGGKRISLHLRDSRKALRYLELCQKNSKKAVTDNSANSIQSAADTKTENKLHGPTSRFAELLGTWIGNAIQPNSRDHQRYQMTLVVYETEGVLKFTANYPSLNCKGAGTFVASSGNELEFAERITDGRSRCIDGVARLTVVSSKRVEWNWGDGIATGTLQRSN